MPAITHSRLEEIRSLAMDVIAAMGRGGGGPLADQVAQLSEAVAEVNGSLAEVDELLLDGLTSEATSMHDPALVGTSRLLDLRSKPNWMALHGWLLERGQPPPPPVNLEAAELLDAAGDQPAAVRDALARLRRRVLERAPLVDRLELLRGLRDADPANLGWAAAVAEHEAVLIQQIRLAAPQALASGDIESLGAYAEQLADPRWERSPPADLLPITAGATAARELAAAAVESTAIAGDIFRLMADEGPTTPRGIDAVAALRQRFLGLEDKAAELVVELEAHPRMLLLVRERGLDEAVSRTAKEATAALERVRVLADSLRTSRDFEAACRRLEHLCDHPPEKGAEGQWLADLHRHDLVARAACQELPRLAITPLLRERIQRAVSVVESREHLRRRFWVVTAGALALGLLATTATTGWIAWSRSDYARTIHELERRAAEAQAGLHLERPGTIDRLAGRYAGDARIATLLEEFEAGVAEEQQRIRRFKAGLSDHAERVEELAAEVADRQAAGEDFWLGPWPASYAPVVITFAAARRGGGLPDQRGAPTSPGNVPAPARQRLETEETELAEAEARQARLARTLDGLARQAFDARLARIQDRLPATKHAADARPLLADLRNLRELAAAGKADGLPDGGGPRIPSEAVATLSALEARLQLLADEIDARPGESP